MSSLELVEHFFRREYGRLVATLSRRFGVQHIETIEDAVQSSLMAALETWSIQGQPDNPSAWLFRVAQNELTGELRKGTRRQRLLEEANEGETFHTLDDQEPFLSGEIPSDLLRMLFVCCDEMIPIESRLVLALKTLCGFDVREIGHRLFISEENAYKRLGRARARLRQISDFGVDLSSRRTVQRLPAVHQILYLLFTEGYLSTHAESAVRRELCDEACRLTTLLSEHPIGQTPETFALLALMHLHLARMGGRQDSAGGLLLLEEQDRSLWDVGEVARGLRYLAESATGDRFSRYHAEAAVAAEHCLAPSFAETRWDRVAESYSLLEQVAPSAIHRLNRAIAVAEWKGAESGLLVLENFEPPPWLRKSYLWAAALADLHARCRDQALAAFHREAALRLAPNAAIRELLERRLCGATSERQR